MSECHRSSKDSSVEEEEKEDEEKGLFHTSAAFGKIKADRDQAEVVE